MRRMIKSTSAVILCLFLTGCITTSENEKTIKEERLEDRTETQETPELDESQNGEVEVLQKTYVEKAIYQRDTTGLPDPPTGFEERDGELGLPLTDFYYNKDIWIYSDVSLEQITSLIGNDHSQEWPKPDGSVSYSFNLSDGGSILFGLSPKGLWMVYPRDTQRFSFAGYPPMPWKQETVTEYFDPNLESNYMKNAIKAIFFNYDNFRLDFSDDNSQITGFKTGFKTGLPQEFAVEKLIINSENQLEISFTSSPPDIFIRNRGNKEKKIIVKISDGDSVLHEAVFEVYFPRGLYAGTSMISLNQENQYKIEVFIDSNNNLLRDAGELYSISDQKTYDELISGFMMNFD